MLYITKEYLHLNFSKIVHTKKLISQEINLLSEQEFENKIRSLYISISWTKKYYLNHFSMTLFRVLPQSIYSFMKKLFIDSPWCALGVERTEPKCGVCIPAV